MASSAATVIAAGGVLWRPSKKHGIKIAVVHRPRYDDWSLPKGKAHKGESTPATAVREVTEETGFAARLGRQVATVSYPVSGGTKVVHYFSARALGGSFVANKEVDELVWSPVHKARKLLSYEHDHTVLDMFCSLPADLATVVLVRHARAGARDDYSGSDAERPLDTKGFAQAALLVSHLLPFGPASISAAPLVRCRQTVQRLADALHVIVEAEPTLSESAYQRDPAAGRRRVVELALREAGNGPAVVCSQGGVIPGVIKSLASREDLSLATAATPKGSYWVLSFEGKQLRQADRYLLPD